MPALPGTGKYMWSTCEALFIERKKLRVRISTFHAANAHYYGLKAKIEEQSSLTSYRKP